MRALFSRAKSFWRGFRRPVHLEREMDEEMRFHIDLDAERLVHEEGLEPLEARRRAWIAFGGIEKHKEQGREARGLGWLTGVPLDLKLGFRMLVKYPGLTVVGGLAIAFAICVGAATFEFVSQVFDPSLPLPEADRIVGIRTWDAAEGKQEPQVAADYLIWREQLQTVEQIGAFRTSRRNLITAAGPGAPIPAAEITATGFALAGVPPLLGRTLLAADELPGAARAVVIGHDVWQSRFAGAANVIGQAVRIGDEPATVVGVMPEGYGFPVAQSLWLPLQLNAAAQPRQGLSIHVFGRLAPEASVEEAQTELTRLVRAAAAASPQTHEHLRPQVMPYARSILNMSLNFTDELDLASIGAMIPMSLNIPLLLFLLLVCGNVALLMFARAATRESEIVVRNALGASRRRIVMQLFVEALVLGVVAAAVGLAAAGYAMRWGLWLVEFLGVGRLPFWFDASISPRTLAYAAVLTVLAAAVAGIAPALKITRGLGSRLRQGTAGGGGFRFGGVWSAVIVAQVAITMPFPVLVMALRSEAAAIAAVDLEFAEEEYLSARIALDREGVAPSDTGSAALQERLESTLRALEERLSNDPTVEAVTFASILPRMYHPYRLIDVDSGAAAPLDPRWPAYRVSSVSVDTDYFEVLGVPILSGRGFNSADITSDVRPIIVNRSFVERVLGSRNPIGRRVRYRQLSESRADSVTEDPWHEIVGVVPDLGNSYGDDDPKIAGFYHPAAPASMRPALMAVRVRGDAAGFGPALLAAATAVDPALRVDAVMPLNEIIAGELRFYSVWFWFTVLMSGIALLLSLAGIYAVMSFTVSQRTREIGIRVALGASRRRVVTAIFRRPLRQVAVGVGAGGLLLLMLLIAGNEGMPSIRSLAILVVYIAIMLGVCMLSWVVPTRRALMVEPTEALRADG